MISRPVAFIAALTLCASLPAGVAFAQYYPAGPQIYRDGPPPPGARGLPPSWLVDEDDDGPLPPPGYYQNGQPAIPPGYMTPPESRRATPGPAGQPPVAAVPPDVVRPPVAIGPGAQPPQGAAQGSAPVATASLPPEDQPEAGEPKALSPELQKQLVDYTGKEPAGTIVIDTAHTFLYLTLGNGKALRYGIGVGREGFTWAGTERISRMKEWPDWFPPAEMIERQPYLPRMMAGGNGNPLGARALYLGNTLYRIHGTNQPSTIGQYVSSGCIRLLNKDIEDLFSRVQVGTRVVVLPAPKSAPVAEGQKPMSVMTIGESNPPQGGPNTAAVTSAPIRPVR